MYALNEQVSKYGIMVFFSSKTLVLTNYGFMLSCIRIMHLALPDDSTPHYIYCLAGFLTIKTSECCIVLKSHIPGGDVVFL